MKDLPREEWDFSRSYCHTVPDEAWYYFFSYEYGREVEVMRQAHARALAQIKTYPFDEYGNWDCVFFQELFGDDLWDHTFRIKTVHINAPPGFPDVPYIKTNHRITERAYRQLDNRKHSSLEPAFVEDAGFVDEEGIDCWPKPIHSFCINWDDSDTKINQAFKEWLKVARPTKSTSQGVSEVRRLEGLLKALGVYRLRRHYGSVNAAMEYTQSHGWSHGYFANETDWSKENTKAEKIIDSWSRLTY